MLKAICCRLCSGEAQVDDAMAVAHRKLLYAMIHFDPARARFVTYVYWRVRGRVTPVSGVGVFPWWTRMIVQHMPALRAGIQHGLRRAAGHCLIQVSDDVVGVFNADGHAYQAVAYVCPLARLGAHARVGHAGRMLDKRLHPAQADR